MKKALFPILIFLLAVLLPAGSFAQNTHPYPIKVQTFIAPPYSLRLSDYVESGYDRISVTVSSRDETVLNYRISLKLVIESFDSRIRIETSPSYMSFPVFLTGTNPDMLSAYDVQDLFEISRLNFTGLSKNEYLRTGKLPEGYYRIGFVALPYKYAGIGQERPASKYGFATVGLFLNDPPILNLPRKQEKVVLYEPRRILFEWTPRHKGSPNSAFDAEYVFRLYEVWDSWADANITASTRTPLFETVTSSPRYSYGIEAPELIPGKSYVWTVQAREEQNRDLFRNNGMSEAFIFQYGDECKIPLSLEGEPASGAGIELAWQGSAEHTGYLVRYRTAGTTDGWFEENSLISSARLNNLSYGITFEIQVMAECGSFSSGYCEPLMVAIPEEAPRSFACGTTGNLPPITNKEPLEVLLAGSTFTAGGFRCRVKEATGSNGEFSGTCLVVIPFYGYASVLHTFKNIKINTDYQMYAGKLVAVKDKEKQQEFARLLDDRPPVYTSGYNTDELAMILGAGNIISLDEPIKKIIAAPENGQYIVTYQDGTTDTIQVEEGTTAVVEDPKGNQYFIEDGKVKKINPEMAAAAVAASQGTAQSTTDPDSLRDALPLVRFVPATDMIYGFDSLYYEALRSQYETKQVKGENYVVPFKAVATGQTDAIQAGIPAGEYNGEALKFKSGEVTVASSPTGTGNNRKLSVTVLSAGDIEPLEAVYTIQDTAGNLIEETLGILNVVGYDAQSMKLYIVPVNPESSTPYNASAINSTLNTVYSQAVMQWDVYPHDPLYIDATEINDEQGSFDNTDSDDRMDYTPAMKKVKKAFKKAFPEEKDAVYVFLIKGQCTDNSISGYMPFKGQYAFVFENQLQGESVEHTIAHEVAHGAFNLRHTFSNECPYYQAGKTSKNLMDYAGSDAITLNKYQWDLVHDPEVILFTWLQDEEEGENTYSRICSVSGDGETFQMPGSSNEYYTFTSISNKPVSISRNTTDLRFSEQFVCDKWEESMTDHLQDNEYNDVINSYQKLTSFKIDNIQYKARIKNNEFDGYYAVKNSDFGFPVTIPSGEKYIDPYTPERNDIVVYLPNEQGIYSVCQTRFEANSPYYADGAITSPGLSCSQDYLSDVKSFADALDKMIKEDNYIKQTWQFLSESKVTEYQDKFSVFKNETGGKSIYILSHPLSFDMLESQKSEFSKAVIEKCSSFNKQKMLLLCIPYYFPYSYQANNLTPDNKLASVQGYKTNFIIDSDNDFIEDFYKQVPKPYQHSKYLITYRGEIIILTTKRVDNDTKHSSVFDLEIAIDERTDAYIDVIRDIEANRISNDYPYVELPTYQDELDKFINFNTYYSNEKYIPVSHGLKESLLKPLGDGSNPCALNFTQWYVQNRFKEIDKTIADVNIPYGAYVSDDCFLLGVNEIIYSDVLSAIDATGILLSFTGLDFTTDIIGALYTGYYGDWDQTKIYSIGLAIPFGVIAFKGGKITYESIQELAKGTNRLVKKGEEYMIVDNLIKASNDIVEYAGIITKEGKNLLNLESPTSLFRQLISNNNTYRAANFWTDQSTEIIHYISKDAKYYIKHDPTNGRVLFIDIENNKFLGFALDEDGLINGNYENLIDNLKTIHGLPGGSKSINIKGTTINFTDDKANLVLGKYNPNGTPGISGEIGTDDVINELTILKNYSFADKTFELRNGSLHILNIPDGMINQATFFDDYNKGILDLAVNNPTKVRVTLVSDPRKADLLRKFEGTIATNNPTGFAMEIKYLREKGVKNVYLKDGTTINLDNINLDNLKWD